MEASAEQASVSAETASNNEQEHNEECMEETEDYGYDGEDYRHFIPRGRGGFRCVTVFPNTYTHAYTHIQTPHTSVVLRVVKNKKKSKK